MKKYNFILRILLLLPCFLIVCTVIGNNLPDSQLYSDDEILAALEPDIRETVLSMPLEKQKKQLETYRYGLLIADYVVLEDTIIKLDITQDQALEKGVPKEIFNRFLSEIEAFNNSIQTMKAEGIDIKIPNLKDTYTPLRNTIENNRRHNRKSSDR